MAEQKQLVAPPVSPRHDVYRPLSGIAVASFILAVVYALLMGVVAVVAMTKGIPLFMAVWTLVIPIAGVTLAYIARRQIRTSGGIRGGMALTKWATWLCIIFGLGYFAYYVGTRMAVTWQAEQYTDRWIDALKKGDVNRGFLETLAPLKRKSERVADLERYTIPVGRNPGPLVIFRQLEMVRTLAEWRDQAHVTRLGVKNWEYEKGAYVVTQSYRIKTPAAEGDYDVAVQSAEGPEHDGRQWQIMRDSLLFPAPAKLTELGHALDQWRQEARSFAGDWLRKRYNGDAIGAFLDTIPEGERAARQRELLACFLSGLAAQPNAGPGALVSLWPMHMRAPAYSPAYKDFVAGKFVNTDGFMAPQRVRADAMTALSQEFGARPGPAYA